MLIEGEVHHSLSSHRSESPTRRGWATPSGEGCCAAIRWDLPWEIAGRMGSLAATYVLEQVGTQSHHYTPAEFVGRYRAHFDDKGALDALLD